MVKIGSHVAFTSKKEYLVGAAQDAVSYGGNSMMIYLGAPQNSKRVSVEKYNLTKYLEEYSQNVPLENIVVHAPYIVNPGSMEKYQFAIDFLVKEIERMNFIGAKHLVLHPGAHTKFNRQDALNRLVNSLNEILDRTKDVVISLETMAGKGTEICTSLKEMQYVIEKVNSERVGVCFDTCHVWDSGIDIGDYPTTIKLLKEHNLLNKINVIHLNDSKNVIGAGKDRHANLKDGMIGADILRKYIFGEEFKNVIKILETPWINGVPPYKEEIELLLSV